MLGDESGNPIGANTCHIPAHFCHYEDGAGWVYDEITIESAAVWDQKCGREFWSTHYPEASSIGFDWHTTLRSTQACTGTACLTSSQLKTRPRSSCDQQCLTTGGDVWGGNDCSLDLDRYSSQLVYLAQLRTNAILNTSGIVGNETKSSLVALELRQVERGLQSYLDMLGAHGAPASSVASGIPLLQAQLSSTQTIRFSTASMIGAGSVPAFNREYYSAKLSTYVTAFETLMDSLQKCIADDEKLNLFQAE